LDELESRLLSTTPSSSKRRPVLAVSPDQQLLAFAEMRDRIHLWQLTTGAELDPIVVQKSFPIRALRFSPDSRSLVVLGLDFISILIVSDGWKKQSLLDGHKVHVWEVAFTKDGQLMASASLDGTAKLWDFRSGKLLKTFSGNREGASSVSISPDGRTLAVLSGVAKKRIKLWSLSSFREVAELPIQGIPEFLDFSPTGETLFGWRPYKPGAHFEFWHSDSKASWR
jgi:WD40 repeat protein